MSCAVVLAASTALAFYFLYLPKKYSQFVERYADECGVDSDLVYAVIRCESGFDEDAMSRSGAIGLMQLLPETANYISRLAGKEHAPDLYDAESNIRTGVLYLVYLRQRFSTLSEILAAYNAGEGRVNAWLCDPTSQPMRSPRCRGPMGWLQPSCIAISISSAEATPSCRTQTPSLQ